VHRGDTDIDPGKQHILDRHGPHTCAIPTRNVPAVARRPGDSRNRGQNQLPDRQHSGGWCARMCPVRLRAWAKGSNCWMRWRWMGVSISHCSRSARRSAAQPGAGSLSLDDGDRGVRRPGADVAQHMPDGVGAHDSDPGRQARRRRGAPAGWRGQRTHDWPRRSGSGDHRGGDRPRPGQGLSSGTFRRI
jgi:hypothetical protein